jgi:predicted DCC family thiol-disulfide oxidoreductase YuxK
MSDDAPLMLFDGLCNFCSGSARFVLERSRGRALRFCAMQTPPGQAWLRHLGLALTDYDTMVLVERGTAHVKSAAVLRIAGHMDAPTVFVSPAGAPSAWCRILKPARASLSIRRRKPHKPSWPASVPAIHVGPPHREWRGHPWCRHCEPKAKQSIRPLDCFVAALLAMSFECIWIGTSLSRR